MEEMRSDTGTVPPATSAVTETPTKVQADTAAAEPPSSRRRGGGQKRKAQSISGGNTFNNHSASASSKRQAREKLNTVPFPQIHHNGPCTRARQQPASFLDDAVVKSEVEALRLPESRGGEAVKAEEESIEDWEALEAKVEAQYDAIRSRDVNAHVVPIPAGWFSWTKVHPLEERVLPSFFDGKSEKRSPEIYMEIRNWIMNRFHANLNTQIGVKDLSELSVGELDARQEVMEFLNYWGLINYHPFPSTDSAILSADVDKEASMGSLVEKLYRFEMEQSSAPVASKTNAAAPTVPSRLFPESAFAEDATRSEGPAVEYHCNSCSADCSRKRYHCQKQADYDLCTECFTSGKFDSDMSPSDFILMEPAEAAGASGGKWTDQETLLLLEALELFSENWNEIAEHVATKTKAQCILHFVQMPIEDTFLDCDEDMDTSIKNSADPDSTKDDASAPKDAPETTEPIDEVSDKPSSPSMEISKLVDASEAKKILEPEDVSEPKVNEEIGENCALKALREAFEAVGSLPLPEEQFSFAEAGNPVMALAAFLVRLGEPNTITASACTSVKSTLGNASGVQLAARHCFLLEEPRDDKNKPFNSERGVDEMVEQDGQKDENLNDEKHEEESNSGLDHCNLSNEHDNREKKDSVTEEMEEAVPNGECTDNSNAAKESDLVVTHEEVEPAIPNRSSDNQDLSKKQEPCNAKEPDALTNKVELPSSLAKESEEESSVGRPSQSAEAQKDDKMVSDPLPSDHKESEQPIMSNIVAENGANAGNEEAKDCKIKDKEAEECKIEDKEAEDCKIEDKEAEDQKNESKSSMKSKDDYIIENVKRAAVTAISAAAVKAKILANQEEDQIRQLATSLVEKQLHKLETKLTFFAEMESVVMRVREQLERSKQKLYHERAQIIAARLGLSASSSRPMQQPLPSNKAAISFANSVPRPPMSTTSQKPPISRPVIASAPPSHPFAPATTAANSVLPSNQDKLSSARMK